MKKQILLIVLGLFVLTLNAQKIMEKGDIMLNAGIGVFSNHGLIPSINASMEIGVIPTGDIGIVTFGGIAAYQLGLNTYYAFGYADENYTYSVFVVGGRASWHLQTFESDKWDVYAGAGLGVEMRSGYKVYGYNYDGDVSPYGEGFVGGRMMMSESFGLFGEVGYGTLSSIKFGVTFGF